MAYELILSSDTLNIGRQKINNFVVNASVGTWTAATPNWSITSRAGVSNYNSFVGNYGFIVGKNNSGITGNYSSVVGGSNNSIYGSLSFIANGYKNKVKDYAGDYNFLGTGKYNYISEGASSTFSTILNGQNNKINSNGGTILNGVANQINGQSNVILGGVINLIKSTSTPISGPSANILFGSQNIIYGSTSTNLNTLLGSGNKTYGKFLASTSVSRYNFTNGKSNNNYLASYCFMHGRFLNNAQSAGANFRSDVVMFGRGSSTANPLRPSNQYSMILGSVAAGGTFRAVRLEFGGSPNAFLKSGAWNATGADYGEYFEWEDQNINNESRIGFFVNISNGKIKISDSTESIGVVSNTTAFIGDVSEDEWLDISLKDEWGNILKKKYKVYNFTIDKKDKEVFFDENDTCFEEVPNYANITGTVGLNYDKNNGIFIEEREFPILNPNFDSNKKYIPRSQRKEWDVIGLLGKLRVRTSEQINSNFVDVDSNTGMAKNGTKYPILKKIKDFDGNYGIVLIFFK